MASQVVPKGLRSFDASDAGFFLELLAILDQELRLVTPTDLQGRDEGGRMKDEPGKPDDSSVILPPSSLRYYQLTHDYLVHSLRDWLTLGKKQTRRGRAELLLQDRAGTWNARPENRLLPSLSEFLTIRIFAGDSVRSGSQIQIMRKAGRFHGIRAMAMLSVLAIGTMNFWPFCRQICSPGAKLCDP